MKNIISLIDTNVLINFITKRDDFYKDSCVEIMKLCAENVFKVMSRSILCQLFGM